MTLDELESRVVAKAARYAAAQLRKRVPPKRIKTLQAVQYRTQGPVAQIGLRFAVRYASRNTETGRWMAMAWSAIRPETRKRMIIALNEGLEELLNTELQD